MHVRIAGSRYGGLVDVIEAVHALGYEVSWGAILPAARKPLEDDLAAAPLDADAIVTLPGWQRDPTAVRDVLTARSAGIPVVDAETVLAGRRIPA